jgi:hypothetical protein
VFFDGTGWYPVAAKKLLAVITRVANSDLHYFEKLYQDPYDSEKLDPDLDPHYSQNKGALEAQKGTIEIPGPS